MHAHRKTRSELEAELAEQLEALRDSASAYDSGKFWEAKRLAAVAYILLYDGGQTALLDQLGLKSAMLFTSTVAPPDSRPILPLAIIQGSIQDGKVSYVPFLDEWSTSRRELKWSKWMSETVYELGSGKKLSRKNLIYLLRNKMGGGHVDGAIENEALNWLKSGAHEIRADGPWRDANGNPVDNVPFPDQYSGRIPNGHWATMRQIAWELDYSFRRHGH
jgi:hypothetical protein